MLLLVNVFLLLKFLLRMYFYITFKNRRECSYHIEYEDNNRVKQNIRLFFGNPFNLLDFSGHILMISYCALYFSNDNKLAETISSNSQRINNSNYCVNLVHIFAVFIILTRGSLSTFRLFGKTRYLVGMILAVFNDIEGFLCILLTSSLVFSVTFLLISQELDEKDL